MKLTLLVIVAAVAIGLLTGGRLANLVRVRVRMPLLAPIGLGLQLIPVESRTLALAMLYVSFAVLLVFVISNIRVAGVPLILLGLVLNLAVIAWNEGMPVTTHALVASGQRDTLNLLVHEGGAKHHLATPGDGLMPLADVIPIGWGIDQAVSVGDIATHFGIAWLIVAAMRKRPDDRMPVRRGTRSDQAVALDG
jgi:hypothetical protein